MAAPTYISGDVRPRKVTIATALSAAIGDIIGLASNTAQKASGQAWDTNLATTQTAFALLFAGLSLQQKSANVARIFGNSEDNVIVLATGGVWELDIASATVEVGEFYGPAKDTGNALVDQTLVKVSGEALAIGQCVERGTTATRVKIQLLPNLFQTSRKA